MDHNRCQGVLKSSQQYMGMMHACVCGGKDGGGGVGGWGVEGGGEGGEGGGVGVFCL